MLIKGCCGGNEILSDFLKENKFGCIIEKRRLLDYVFFFLYIVDFLFVFYCYNFLRLL